PDECSLRADVRAPTAATLAEVMEEVGRIARRTVVPDTTIELQTQSGFPPMEKTGSTARLVELAQAIAGQLGFEVHDAATGGASDANVVAGMGVPTLDGLGRIG